jgi:hypothetical protein
MTKIIDLRPDKKFVNINFEKYQFCSDGILTKEKKELQTGKYNLKYKKNLLQKNNYYFYYSEILHIELNISQDSWLEARLFAFHNHLFKNPYDSTCWFIDRGGGIWRFKDNGSLDLIYTSNIMNSKSCNFTYNPSIAFASKNKFIISNGGGTIEFLIEQNGCIKNVIFDIEPAIILDAKFIQETMELIIAIYIIDELDGKKFSKLCFLFYNYEENNTQSELIIKFIYKKILEVNGAIEYVYIENNGKFYHIISQDHIKFEYDFTKAHKIKNDSSDKELQIKKPRYCWSQDEDSIIIYIQVAENYNKFLTKIDITSTSISIAVANLILLNGKTFNRLEPELTTWKHKGSSLEIELFKSESGLIWSELIKDDTEGKYLPNEELTGKIHSRYKIY